jgi:hypothetical protein
MGKPITQYQSDDGEIFPTREAMDRHEAAQDLVRIDAWIASVADWPRGEMARARRLVADFVAFERGAAPAPADPQPQPKASDLEPQEATA